MQNLRMIIKLFFIIFSITNLFAQEIEKAELGNEIYENLVPSIFQIKTSIDANSPKTSYGSGFVINEEGILATNYHVVSSVLLDEDVEYKAFVVISDNEIKEAKILAIDIIHDLAILKIDHKFNRPLKFNLGKLNKGQKIFSLGIPKDLNLSIVEGTFNGMLKYSIYEQIHMSSAINSGMSGGPTVDEKGSVVGLNVAVLINSQNISFSVPVKYLQELHKTINDKSVPLNKNSVFQLINSQGMKVEKELFRDFISAKQVSSSMAGWNVFSPPESLKCWSQVTNSKSTTVLLEHQYCDLKGSSYLKDNLNMGTYSLTYKVVKNKDYYQNQFYNTVNAVYNSETSVEVLKELDSFITPPDCNQKIVVNKNKIPFKINYCIRNFIHFPQLFLVDIKGSSLGINDSAMIFELELEGFSMVSFWSMFEKIFEKFEYRELKK